MLGGEGLFVLFSAPLSKIVPRALLLSLAYVVLPRMKEKKRKNICWVWNSSWLLGGVLTGS